MWSPHHRTSSCAWFSKRKLEDPPDIGPSKILITEEKMANELSGLHLSSTYTSHGSPITPPEPAKALPTLSLCDELRALQANPLPILPKSLMEHPRPTQALVLWQPPAGTLGRPSEDSSRPKSPKRQNNKYNENDLMMESEELELEPIPSTSASTSGFDWKSIPPWKNENGLSIGAKQQSRVAPATTFTRAI